MLSLLKTQLGQIHSQFSCADRVTDASRYTALNDAISRLPVLGIFIPIQILKRGLQPDANNDKNKDNDNTVICKHVADSDFVNLCIL